MRAKRKGFASTPGRSAEPLYREIRAILDTARSGAYRVVNAAMVRAYWNVGRLIVEHEQKGCRRAGYGDAVIATLAERLTADLGRGFDERDLRSMRACDLAFPIRNALRAELLSSGKLNAARSELGRRQAEIFATKYVKVLPTDGGLTGEIERERLLIDAHAAKETFRWREG